MLPIPARDRQGIRYIGTIASRPQSLGKKKVRGQLLGNYGFAKMECYMHVQGMCTENTLEGPEVSTPGRQ